MSDTRKKTLDLKSLKAAASALATRTSTGIDRMLGQDAFEKIRQECTFLRRYASGSNAIPGHVVQAFAAAAASAGIITNEVALARLTRDLADNDTSPMQQLWRTIFPESDITLAVDFFMDRVPGATVAGGTNHRIYHGHDLNALTEILREHDAEGALQWINHVMVRDFWTPHGVPYLPTGSESVYQWMVEQGVSPSTAADILTLNIVEFVSGLFMLRAVLSLMTIARHFANHIKIQQHLSEAVQLQERNSFEGAQEHFREALRLSDSSPALQLHYSITQMEAAHRSNDDNARSNHLWAAYNEAYGLLNSAKVKPQDTVEVSGGALLSIKGLAGYILVCGLPGTVESGASPSQVQGQIKDGVRSFLKTADTLSGRLRIKSDRRLSAVLNCLLALELSLLIKNPVYGEDPLSVRSAFERHANNLIEPVTEQGKYVASLKKQVLRMYPMAA